MAFVYSEVGARLPEMVVTNANEKLFSLVIDKNYSRGPVVKACQYLSIRDNPALEQRREGNTKTWRGKKLDKDEIGSSIQWKI